MTTVRNNINNIIAGLYESKQKCPKCGSTDIEIDIDDNETEYECRSCGYEWEEHNSTDNTDKDDWDDTDDLDNSVTESIIVHENIVNESSNKEVYVTTGKLEATNPDGVTKNVPTGKELEAEYDKDAKVFRFTYKKISLYSSESDFTKNTKKKEATNEGVNVNFSSEEKEVNKLLKEYRRIVSNQGVGRDTYAKRREISNSITNALKSVSNVKFETTDLYGDKEVYYLKDDGLYADDGKTCIEHRPSLAYGLLTADIVEIKLGDEKQAKKVRDMMDTLYKRGKADESKAILESNKYRAGKRYRTEENIYFSVVKINKNGSIRVYDEDVEREYNVDVADLELLNPVEVKENFIIGYMGSGTVELEQEKEYAKRKELNISPDAIEVKLNESTGYCEDRDGNKSETIVLKRGEWCYYCSKGNTKYTVYNVRGRLSVSKPLSIKEIKPTKEILKAISYEDRDGNIVSGFVEKPKSCCVGDDGKRVDNITLPKGKLCYYYDAKGNRFLAKNVDGALRITDRAGREVTPTKDMTERIFLKSAQENRKTINSISDTLYKRGKADESTLNEVKKVEDYYKFEKKELMKKLDTYISTMQNNIKGIKSQLSKGKTDAVTVKSTLDMCKTVDTLGNFGEYEYYKKDLAGVADTDSERLLDVWDAVLNDLRKKRREIIKESAVLESSDTKLVSQLNSICVDIGKGKSTDKEVKAIIKLLDSMSEDTSLIAVIDNDKVFYQKMDKFIWVKMDNSGYEDVSAKDIATQWTDSKECPTKVILEAREQGYDETLFEEYEMVLAQDSVYEGTSSFGDKLNKFIKPLDSTAQSVIKTYLNNIYSVVSKTYKGYTEGAKAMIRSDGNFRALTWEIYYTEPVTRRYMYSDETSTDVIKDGIFKGSVDSIKIKGRGMLASKESLLPNGVRIGFNELGEFSSATKSYTATGVQIAVIIPVDNSSEAELNPFYSKDGRRVYLTNNHCAVYFDRMDNRMGGDDRQPIYTQEAFYTTKKSGLEKAWKDLLNSFNAETQMYEVVRIINKYNSVHTYCPWD